MRLLKQSTAASVMVLMVDSTDHVTGKTGLTLTITASKNGAAFASISPTVNERGSGWYELQLTTAHTDTLGDLALHITGTAADAADTLSYVIVRHLADLAWPATSGRSLAVTAAGAVDVSDIAAGAITSSEAPALANLDVAISTRSSHSASDVWSVGARTLTSFGTLVSDIATAVWAAGARTLTSFGTLAADVWTNATRTLTSFGTLIADVWTNATRTLTASLDPSAAQIRSEIDSNSTQLAGIKSKTDNLPSGVKRNTALAKFSFLMVDSADHVTPKTGLTGFTAQRSLDGAAFASCANAVSELSNGIYLIDLAAGDLDGDVVTLRFTATGGDARLLTVLTEP